MKKDRLATVIDVLDAIDPEGLIKMGAPKGEYSPEAKSILAAIDAGKKFDAELVRSVWAEFFGLEKESWNMPMRPAFEQVVERIRTDLGLHESTRARGAPDEPE